MHGHSALAQYQNNHTVGQLTDADPHKLVAMLIGGARQRLQTARGQIERGELAGKLRSIASAVSIIEGLRIGLDTERGGEIASNLEQLYDYSLRRLAQANATNDTAALDEVLAVLSELATGWDGIRDAPAQSPGSAA